MSAKCNGGVEYTETDLEFEYKRRHDSALDMRQGPKPQTSRRFPTVGDKQRRRAEGRLASEIEFSYGWPFHPLVNRGSIRCLNFRKVGSIGQ